MKIKEVLREYDSSAATQQMKRAFEKTQQRQQFYGKTAGDIQGDPSEIGDTWDDYKSYIKTFGRRPQSTQQTKPTSDLDSAVPLDPEKLQKPKFTPGLSDPWDTEPNTGTVG